MQLIFKILHYFLEYSTMQKVLHMGIACQATFSQVQVLFGLFCLGSSTFTTSKLNQKLHSVPSKPS